MLETLNCNMIASFGLLGQRKQSVCWRMSGQQESIFEIDEDQYESNMFENSKSKVLAVLNKLKAPFLLLLILVSWITLGVKISKLSSEVDSNQLKLTYDSFHSRAAAAEDCQELRNHGFSTSGYFLIGNQFTDFLNFP